MEENNPFGLMRFKSQYFIFVLQLKRTVDNCLFYIPSCFSFERNHSFFKNFIPSWDDKMRDLHFHFLFWLSSGENRLKDNLYHLLNSYGMDKMESKEYNSPRKLIPSWIKMTSEQHLAQSRTNYFNEWIIYDPRDGASLEEWLENNRPSQLSREDHIGWISVRSKNNYKTNAIKTYQADADRIQKAWEDLKMSQAPITYEKICSLAQDCNYTSGKWLFYAESGYKVDLLWKIVATNVVNGPLGKIVSSAEVSPFNPSEEDYEHAFCIKNGNFTNPEEVLEVEKEIRKAGIKCRMTYKPSVYSVGEIYGNNSWNMNPTIYISTYDVLSHSSKTENRLTHEQFYQFVETPKKDSQK